MQVSEGREETHDTDTEVRAPSSETGTQSLSRGLAMLEAFIREKREFSVTELAQHLGVGRSTSYRLGKTLEQYGFLKFNPSSRSYSIGSVAFAVGSLFTPLSFSSAAGEIMRDLRAETTHTVHLAVVDGLRLLNIGAEESENMARVVGHVGQRSPLHACAAGKALLATMPDSKIREIVRQTGLPQVASGTIGELSVLLDDVRETRRRGYGMSKDELANGLHSVGMVVRAENCANVYTLAVSMPPGILQSPGDELPIVDQLRKAANRLRIVISRGQF